RTVTLPLGARALLVNNASITTLSISGHPVLAE
ncbi:muramoyltetrapeptide carboxypeptidase, partial [Klebsiella michiganensis]